MQSGSRCIDSLEPRPEHNATCSRTSRSLVCCLDQESVIEHCVRADLGDECESEMDRQRPLVGPRGPPAPPSGGAKPPTTAERVAVFTMTDPSARGYA